MNFRNFSILNSFFNNSHNFYDVSPAVHTLFIIRFGLQLFITSMTTNEMLARLKYDTSYASLTN